MKTFLLLFAFFISSLSLTAQDGTVDPSFGNNGMVNTIYNFSSTAFQTSGKLIGVQGLLSGFEMYRYNLDGTLDQTFGNNGKVNISYPTLTNVLQTKVAIEQSNNKIVVQVIGRGLSSNLSVGYFTALNRFEENGGLDPSFYNQGVLNFLRTEPTTPDGLGVLSDGSIISVVGFQIGRSVNTAIVDKYDNEGYLDQTYTKQLPGGVSFRHLEIKTNDQVVVGGTFFLTGVSSLVLAQFNANGTSQLAPGEFITYYSSISPNFPFSPTPESLSALAVQSDGKIIAASNLKLLRFNVDGSRDKSFGDEGIVLSPSAINDLLIQPDGKIVAALSSTTFTVARFNADLTLDETFGVNGIASANFGAGLGITNMFIVGTRLYAYGNGLLAAFLLNTTCTPPTFLNTLPIVGNATCGNNDGQISIIPQSGTAPYMYSFDGGATYVSGPNAGFTQFNLAAGTYQLRLKDANGCESEVVTRTINIAGCPPTTCTPPTFLNTLPIVGNATCGNNDGQISIIPTSGTGPFMYSFDGGATYTAGPNAGVTRFNLAAGSYQLRLKGATGCESVVVTRVINTVGCPTCTPPTFLNTRPVVGDATCNQSDGQISIIPTSGTGPFMYSINGSTTYVSGPNAGYTFFNLPAGTYQLRLKAGNGCESDVVARTVQSINCPSSTPTITGVNKGFVSDENALESKLKIAAFPNPSRGLFKLQVLQSTASKAEVFIYDGKGTLVQQASINPAKGSIINVNLSGKAKGMYHVKVVTQQGISTSKILIQ